MSTQPNFQSRESFMLVGVERYTENGIPSIRQAWEEFGKRVREIQHTIDPDVCYGFEDYSRDLVMEAGQFPKYYYIASLEVYSLDDIPEGMKSKEVPAANYAVFNYQGPIDGLHSFFKYIYADWMPTSGYKMDPNLSADFERYPQPMTDMQNATVEIWVPVVAK